MPPELEEVCDLCWDDKKLEGPRAVRIVAGVPLCGPCSSMTKQDRFEATPEPDEEDDAPAPVLRAKEHPWRAGKAETKPVAPPKVVTKVTKVTNVTTVTKGPRSAEVAARGIKTGADFCNFMSALMSDLVEKRVSPAEANAACNAAQKLLQMVELQFRHRASGKILKLSDGPDDE